MADTLEQAAKGKPMSDRAARSALGRAADKIAHLTKRAGTSKEAVMKTGAAVVATVEMEGSLFLSSMAEGYWGEDKLKVGNVDVRAPTGLLFQGYGLYQTIRGKKAGGSHALAIGNGILGSWLASVGRNAGRTLAEKRNKPAEPATPAVPEVQGRLLDGPRREILLEDDRPRRRAGRFVRAERAAA